MTKVEDSNNTTARWLTFHRTLAWFRQRYPGATDKQAWDRLQQALILEWAKASVGVPIDKFRYPWAGRIVDLVVLIRNKYLIFEDIQWPKVECNLDWLERDWPAAPISKLDAWVAEHGPTLVGRSPKEGWKKFYNRCRDDCGGWADKKNGKPAAGFSDKTIERRLQHARFK